ncbi:putative methyltransferase-domain-containing protein [Pelagophyceae sp. CCMP2097]|nr:putative methyltransferase-domain-containing protein [Pelagophyceae sp. CCMP2097]
MVAVGCPVSAQDGVIDIHGLLIASALEDFQDEANVDTSGASLWGAGVALATDLLGGGAWAELVRGKRVLEIGCGSGVVGLSALRAGAKRAILTDGSAAALKHAERIAQTNGNLFKGTVDFAALKWGDAAALGAAEKPELILAADVGYDPSSHDLLASTFRALVDSSGATDVLVAEEARWKDVLAFFKQAMAEEFDLTHEHDPARVVIVEQRPFAFLHFTPRRRPQT